MGTARRSLEKHSTMSAQHFTVWRYFLYVFRLPATPFVVTILLSVFGWSFVYLLESLVAAPIVEYSVNWKVQEGNTRVVTVSLENVSRTNRIQSLELGFASRVHSPGKFSETDLHAVAPAAEGRDSKSRITSGGMEVEFIIRDLQPRQQFRLRALYNGNDTPELRLLTANSSVYLYDRGIITYLAKHVIAVVGIIALASLFAVVFTFLVHVRSAILQK